MPFDLLKNAMDLTKAKANSGIVDNKLNTTLLNRPQLNNFPYTINKKVTDLTKYKDPKFIKREAEATAMVLLADKHAEVLLQKSNIEKQAAEIITALVAFYLQFPPKLPAFNPKALAKKAYAKTKKELQQLRQTVSKENLKKGKEAFKYPMKPTISNIPKLPSIPTLPRIPEIPSI